MNLLECKKVLLYMDKDRKISCSFMPKPTDIELKTALIAAETMKEHDKDPFYMARVLLNHHYRLKFYEELFRATDRYMNHGQAEQARMALLKCIDTINQMERKLENDEIQDFGLE